MPEFNAQLIRNGKVIETLTCEAKDKDEAWLMANDGIESMTGDWVAVVPVPEKEEAVSD